VVFLRFHVLYLVRVTYYSTLRMSILQSAAGSWAFALRLHMYSAWNPKDNYDISASVYVV